MTIGKKTLAMMLATASICMASCGNKKSGTDVPGANDSTVVNQQKEMPAEGTKNKLSTPDLTLFGTKGNVKAAKIIGLYHDNKQTSMQLGYDDQGRLTRIDTYNISYEKVESGKVTNKKGNKVKRDKDGRITAIDCADGCSEQQGYHFQYGKNKISYTFDSGECTGLYGEEFILDNEGMEKSATCTSNDEYMNWTLEQNYTYTKFDQYGNWTERTVKWTSTVEEYDDFGDEEQNNKVEKTNGSFTQTRNIEYYE